MNKEQMVVVDWTRGAARVGVFTQGQRGCQLQSEMSLPARLVVRHEPGAAPYILADEEPSDPPPGTKSLIFERPARDLPQIEDLDLQSLLVTGFWRNLRDNLVASGELRSDRTAAGYLIAPHRFPPPLLERFRHSCAGERSLKYCGSVHEAAALLIGLLRSGVFSLADSAMPSEVPVKVCLVVACDDLTLDVACFDYIRVAALHRIVIRDFFQTAVAEFSSRLHDCDWLGSFSALFIVEDPALPAATRATLNAPLQAIAAGVAQEHHQLPGASHLKLTGAAHIASCAAGDAPDEHEYHVSHACHVGVQIDQQYFHPVISKEASAALTEFPYLAAHAFRLRGQSGTALRVNLYSGYSTLVADAVRLGHTMLWQEDLAQLAGVTALTAAIRLDAPSHGEFFLGIMPENRELRRQPFTLLGLTE